MGGGWQVYKISFMKKLPFIVIVIITSLVSLSFTKPVANSNSTGIKWLSWKEVQEAQKKQPRKVFVDVYTDWCGWCKRMDATTFSNPEIVKYINENYYAVKFDAETRESITFKGKEYKFVSSGYRGYNQLAAEILNGQLSYPTTVYFDENLDVIFPIPGYLEPKIFEAVISYIHTNSYLTTTWEKYQEGFTGKIK